MWRHYDAMTSRVESGPGLLLLSIVFIASLYSRTRSYIIFDIELVRGRIFENNGSAISTPARVDGRSLYGSI